MAKMNWDKAARMERAWRNGITRAYSEFGPQFLHTASAEGVPHAMAIVHSTHNVTRTFIRRRLGEPDIRQRVTS